MAQNSNNAAIDVNVETTKTIDAAVGNTGNVWASLEPFAGDVARDCAEKAQKSAEAAAASEQAAKASETAAKDSETAAAGSASAAADSESNAKTSETKAGQSEANAKASADAAAASAQDAHNVAASIGNPVSSVTEVNGKVTVTKSNGEKNEFFAGLNMLQRNKAYAVGDIAYSPNLPSWAYLECVTAGTTGDTEPSFSDITGGGTVADGTSVWIVRDPRKDGADISALKDEIASLKNTIASIQTDISDESNFKVINVNNGAEITRGKDYTVQNPFKGYYVDCIVELYFPTLGTWAQSGNYSDDGYERGMSWTQYVSGNTDEIRIHGGYTSLYTSGHSPLELPDLTSGKCRVLVYKLGRITP